jgi:hypothetical protein
MGLKLGSQLRPHPAPPSQRSPRRGGAPGSTCSPGTRAAGADGAPG